MGVREAAGAGYALAGKNGINGGKKPVLIEIRLPQSHWL